jgi:hypothetical protein
VTNGIAPTRLNKRLPPGPFAQIIEWQTLDGARPGRLRSATGKAPATDSLARLARILGLHQVVELARGPGSRSR